MIYSAKSLEEFLLNCPVTISRSSAGTPVIEWSWKEKSSDMDSNKPLSELYAELGEAWADADAAATLLEDLKSAFLSQKMLTHTQSGVAVNKAEMLVKATREWEEYVHKTVAARKHANKLKVRLEQVRMEHMKWVNEQANERTQARL